MKNVAVLHDALRGETFGFVVKSAGVLQFYGVDQSSSQWAAWVNQSSVKSIHSVEMPPGVIVGAFKQISDSEVERITDGSPSQADIGISSRKNTTYVTTVRIDSKSASPGIFDTPINHFKNGQFFSAINYKGLAFRADAKKSSMLHESKVNKYSFDIETSKFSVRPSFEQKELIRERIESNTSASFERRIGIKSVKFSERDNSRTHVGVAASLETKSIGRTIGGGAARGASRLARRTARFDPKAWDGDGDGLVQEGTAFQRPAIPGVNDRASRGNVNVAAVERAILSDRANQSGTRSRTSRTTSSPETPQRRANQTLPLRARREQASLDAGMRSRTKKASRAVPGVDRVAEIDGTAWDSMDDAQKAVVKENLEARLQAIQKTFKTKTDFWEAYLRNPKNTKRHPGINEDSDFTNDFMVNLQAEIQDAERDAIASIPANADREAELAKIDKKMQEYYRLYDDLRTIRSMKERDNYTSLEHLHPASRDAALGKSRAKNNPYKAVSGTFPSLKRANESTYFGRSGKEKKYVTDTVLETGEKAKIKKRTSEKLGDLSRRVLDPNPKRVARRERRKARKAGVGRTAGQAEAEKKGIGRRIRRARREIAGRLRGRETAGKIAARNESTKPKHPLSVSGDSPGDLKIKVTPQWISGMSFINDQLGKFKRGEKTESKRSGKVTNEALLLTWENMNQNGLPTLIREDQVEMLVSDGWRPVNRGVGNDTGFVDAYLADEDRFIPGQGGSAYGVGEYWAFEGGGFSWSPSYGDARMLAFLSPSARVINRSELDKIIETGRKIKDAIRAYDAGFPEGEAEKTDPKDYVTGLLASLEGTIDKTDWDSPIGQVYKQLIDKYNDSSGKDTEDVWGAMSYVSRMFSHDSNYWAPVLGYDAVETDGGPLVVHNRAAMVVVNKALTNSEGKKIVQDAKAGIVSGVEPKAEKTRKASKGGSKAKVLDTSGWTKTGGQLGSNPGGKYRASDGKEYYVKRGRSRSHVENEVLASRLYETLGVPASRVQVGDDNGQVQVVSEWVQGPGAMSGNSLAERQKMRVGYVADAWLGNWDAFANSGNISQDNNGNGVRIDHGGALNYRAQGATKGSSFGDEAREMESLRDPRSNPRGAEILKDITPQEIKQQVDNLKKVTDQMITQMVSDAISDSQERAELIRKLIARRQWIIQNYG